MPQGQFKKLKKLKKSGLYIENDVFLYLILYLYLTRYFNNICIVTYSGALIITPKKNKKYYQNIKKR